ncbi:hypothetical protein GCM10009092_41740 [Bowmanella denitrificans]|uniref:MipA/OmpV family protein n=1 Tax=Bowmanella denitrificans TaxID=366582 RepID=A0ABN0XV75_9ALTE
MKNYLFWITVFLYLVSGGWVKADNWTLSVGGGAIVHETPWKDMPVQYAVLPYIDAEYGRWHFGMQSGIFQYRLSDEQWPVALSAGLDYRDEGYDSMFNFNDDLSDDPVFDGYHAPDGEVAARLDMNWQHLSATVSQDVSDKSKGTSASLIYMYPVYQGNRGVQVKLGGGFRWLSDKYADYLYGINGDNINPAQGRFAYQADAATNYQASVQLIYPFAAQWAVNAQLTHERLDDSIKQSPLVDVTSTTQFMLFVTYRKF